MSAGDFGPISGFCKLFFCFFQKISAIGDMSGKGANDFFIYAYDLLWTYWQRSF